MEDKALNFTSLKSKIADFDIEKVNSLARTSETLTNPVDTIYDDYGILPKILNEDKIVKIGEYLIKIDLHNERVLVLEEQHKSEYADLVTDNFENSHIMTFSTDDEVLELLENGSKGSVNARMLGCNDEWADAQKHAHHPKSSSKHRLDAKVVYQRAGIYYSILAKGKTQRRRFRIWWRDSSGNCTIYYNCKFALRCGYSYDWVSTQSSSRGESNYRPYQGSRGLEYYYLLGQFRSTHGNTILLIQNNYL